jgi:hypothetical protein
MPTGSAALPWWVDALLILMVVVIVITLIVLVTEMIRNIGAGKKNEGRSVDAPPAPAVNGGDPV